MATSFGHIIWPYQYKLCFSPVPNVCANVQSPVLSIKTTVQLCVWMGSHNEIKYND